MGASMVWKPRDYTKIVKLHADCRRKRGEYHSMLPAHRTVASSPARLIAGRLAETALAEGFDELSLRDDLVF